MRLLSVVFWPEQGDPTSCCCTTVAHLHSEPYSRQLTCLGWPCRGGIIPTEGSGIITWASHTGKLCLGELTARRRQDSSYGGSYSSGLEASRTFLLLPGETVLQVLNP